MSFLKAIFFLVILICFFACDKSKTQLKKIVPVKKKTVGIQPLGNVKPAYLREVQKAIRQYYGFEAKVLPEKKIPESAKNTYVIEKYQLKGYPLRYRADSLIRILKREKSKELDYVIGIIQLDITTTNYDNKGNIQNPLWMHIDWGIFGLGFLKGGSCVVSTFRIAYPYLDTLSYSRIRKVSLHEIGHNLGLDHCKNDQCFMRQVDLKNALLSLDQKPEYLCKECRRKIKL